LRRKKREAEAFENLETEIPAGRQHQKVVSDKVMLANMGVTVDKKKYAGGRLKRKE